VSGVRSEVRGRADVLVLRAPTVRWFSVQAKGERGPSLRQAEDAEHAAVDHVQNFAADEWIVDDDEWVVAVGPVWNARAGGSPPDGWKAGDIVVRDGPETVFRVRKTYTTERIA
jgi:hypothetical protein